MYKKRVIHRFTKEEDDMILQEVKRSKGDIKKAVHILEEKLHEGHSKRSIIERFNGFLSQNQSEWREDEDKIILDVYSLYGGKWTKISKHLKNRSGDQVKIRFRQLVRNMPHLLCHREQQKYAKVDECDWTSIYNEFNEVISQYENDILFM